VLRAFKAGFFGDIARAVAVQAEPFRKRRVGCWLAVTADIEIEPDVLNPRSRGRWITCYIELPENYNVSEIDFNSVTMSVGESVIYPESSPTEIGDYDNDNIVDLMLKFDRQAVSESVSTGSVKMTARGTLIDGSEFAGNNIVNVIDKGHEKNK